jgi:hypothetical protein
MDPSLARLFGFYNFLTKGLLLSNFHLHLQTRGDSCSSSWYPTYLLPFFFFLLLHILVHLIIRYYLLFVQPSTLPKEGSFDFIQGISTQLSWEANRLTYDTQEHYLKAQIKLWCNPGTSDLTSEDDIQAAIRPEFQITIDLHAIYYLSDWLIASSRLTSLHIFGLHKVNNIVWLNLHERYVQDYCISRICIDSWIFGLHISSMFKLLLVSCVILNINYIFCLV